jgi:hypothetical protein
MYQELLDNRVRRYVDYGSLAIAAQAAGDLDPAFPLRRTSPSGPRTCRTGGSFGLGNPTDSISFDASRARMSADKSANSASTVSFNTRRAWSRC